MFFTSLKIGKKASLQDYIDARVELGVLYFKENLLNKATEFTIVIKSDPGNVNAFFNSGLVYKKQNKLDAILSAFEKTIKLNPTHTQAHFKLAVVYHKKGFLNKVQAEYLQSLTYNPQHALTYYNLGVIQLSINQPQTAIQYLTEALLITPNDIRHTFPIRQCILGCWKSAICNKQLQNSIDFRTKKHRSSQTIMSNLL